MTPPRRWWRHVVASLKDQRSLCVTRLAVPWRHSSGKSSLEAAVIQATSHDEQPANQKHACRVFALARNSPAFLDVIMQALARRVARTRSWPVALKALMLAHGLLLCSATAATSCVHLPFDLSGFCDHSAKPRKAQGFSTFIQAYFHFLNYRYTLSEEQHRGGPDYSLERLETMQRLLNLMMQIKPTLDIKTGLICCEGLKAACDAKLAALIRSTDDALLVVDYALEGTAHVLMVACLQTFLRDLPFPSLPLCHKHRPGTKPRPGPKLPFLSFPTSPNSSRSSTLSRHLFSLPSPLLKLQHPSPELPSSQQLPASERA